MAALKQSKSVILRYVGNMIGGLFKILDGILLVLSLGTYRSNSYFKWTMYRRTTIFSPILEVLTTSTSEIKKLSTAKIIGKTIGYIIVTGFICLFAYVVFKDFSKFVMQIGITLLLTFVVLIGFKLIKS